MAQTPKYLRRVFPQESGLTAMVVVAEFFNYSFLKFDLFNCINKATFESSSNLYFTHLKVRLFVTFQPINWSIY